MITTDKWEKHTPDSAGPMAMHSYYFICEEFNGKRRTGIGVCTGHFYNMDGNWMPMFQSTPYTVFPAMWYKKVH